jgi:hypothetical protein
MDNTISRQNQIEETISEMEDKIEEVLHANNYKEKKILHMNITPKTSGT